MELSSDYLKTAGCVVKEMNTLDQSQPGAREALLALSYQLTAILETPSETIQRIGWAEVRRLIDLRSRMETWSDVFQPARFAAIRTAIDLKVFDILNGAGGESVNISQLADQTDAETSLIGMLSSRIGSSL